MKEIILDYVKNVTKEKDLDYLFKNLNSQYIADKFKIKRNTVSQYLNEAASKDLVKINTRPVLFCIVKNLSNVFLSEQTVLL